MTGTLRTTLHHRAEELDAWDVDLDAVIRDGDRRLRRRRAALAGGLAGVLVVAGGVAALAGHGHRTSPPPADQNAQPLAYAVGSVIHTGDGTVDVGVKVESLVAAKSGFFYSGPDRTVYVWRDGHAQALGHIADSSTRLLGSDDGVNVAWWDGKEIVAWPGLRRPVETFRGPKPRYWETLHIVQAVSDERMWFWDGHRTWTANLLPSPSSAVWPDKAFTSSGSVQDAASDRVLVRIGDGLAVMRDNLYPLRADQLGGWRPGSDLSTATGRVAGVSTGDLAPDGRHWFSKDPGHPFTVYDSESGESEAIKLPPGLTDATPYQWLGDDTIAAMGFAHSDGPGAVVSLLTCRVSAGDCTVDVDDAGTADQVVVSDGRPVGG
jgi:hypothetical protein